MTGDSLFILDGYSLIYRSYFAFIKKPLTNKRGENTSALFGFFRTFFSLINIYNPRYFAVAMDSLTPTFRHDQYPEYKATRDKTPEELHDQIPLIEEILEALGVPILRVNGYEADDIMATLAKLCKENNRACYIISGDKDLLQLVDGQVKMLHTEKGDYIEVDREAVYEKWGIYPEEVLDYLALTGDAADNIPGVKGIGPKTAVALLRKYRTLDNIYDHLDELPAGQRKKLEENRENAYLSKKLVVLENNTPLSAAAEDLKLGELRVDAAVPLFLKQDITSIAEEIAGKKAVEEQRPAQAKTGEYSAVLSLEELDRWIEKARDNKWFAFDVETDNLDSLRASPVGICLSAGSGEGCYIPLKAPDADCLSEDEVKKRIRPLLTDPELFCIGQNIKYDYKVMKRWGITITNITFDTMIAAWVLDSQGGSFGMDNLAARCLQYRTVHFNEVVAKGDTFDAVPLQRAVTYAAEDADITYRLFELFNKQLEERKLSTLFFEVEMPLVTILADMELEGILLNLKTLEEYSRELAVELAGIEDKVYTLCGEIFNLNSTKQLQSILFEKRGLQPIKKTKSGFSTDNSVLEELAKEDPVPELVLQYRALSKLKSTYVDALPKLINPRTGKLHTHFMQTGTATGRLSSKDPNLQNIAIRTKEGRKIRASFIPARGNIYVSADYSQIELVILAHLSGDPSLSKAFREGVDVHSQTGSLIFGIPVEEVSSEQRRMAKVINFGIIYGMSGFRLSRELGISRAQADNFIEAYFQKYAGVKSFIDKTIADVEKTGVSKTILGRERTIPGINSQNRSEKMGAERIAVNTPIQGSAADIVKLAMLSIVPRLRKEGCAAALLLQVHDELIFELPAEEKEKVTEIVREEMERAVSLSVPLKVSVETGSSWGELH